MCKAYEYVYSMCENNIKMLDNFSSICVIFTWRRQNNQRIQINKAQHLHFKMANRWTKQTLTLQLLTSSALTMMVPHFFPGIPLEKRKTKQEIDRIDSSVNALNVIYFTLYMSVLLLHAYYI